MLSFVDKVAESSEQSTWGLIPSSSCEVDTEVRSPYARLKMEKGGKWEGSKVIAGANYNSRLAIWGKGKEAKYKEKVSSPEHLTDANS